MSDKDIVRLVVNTRHPQDYVLVNEADGTRWRGQVDGSWKREPPLAWRRMEMADATKRPLPGALVIAALRAMDAEARKRGAMFPQTADEQEEDIKAVRRVIESLEFYTGPRQSRADGWPSVKDWPALPDGVREPRFPGDKDFAGGVGASDDQVKR